MCCFFPAQVQNPTGLHEQHTNIANLFPFVKQNSYQLSLIQTQFRAQQFLNCGFFRIASFYKAKLGMISRNRNFLFCLHL